MKTNKQAQNLCIGAKGNYFVASDHNNIKQYFGNIVHLSSSYFISKLVINNHNLSQLVINSKNRDTYS